MVLKDEKSAFPSNSQMSEWISIWFILPRGVNWISTATQDPIVFVLEEHNE